MCESSFFFFSPTPETDMFFLAISMVGTDFSLIGRLFPHRDRAEIKVKIEALSKASKCLFSLFFFSFAIPMLPLLVLIILIFIGSIAILSLIPVSKRY